MRLRTKREREIYSAGFNAGSAMANTEAYTNGYAAGKKETHDAFDKAGLDTRLKLAASYANVFEAIARSANMFFDRGTNALK